MTSSRKITRLVTHHQTISSTWFQVNIYQQIIAYLTVHNTYIFKKIRYSGKNLDVIMKVSNASNSSTSPFPAHGLEVNIYQQTMAYITVYNTYIFKKFRSSGKNLDVIKKDSKPCNTSPAHFQLMVPK